MAARKNKKGRIAGSGTVSHARKERYQKACAERDRLLALATTEEEKQKAKAIQKKQQKKASGGKWGCSQQQQWGSCTLPKGAEGKGRGESCTLPKGAEGKGRGENCTLPKGAEKIMGGSGLCTLPKGAEGKGRGESCTLSKGAEGKGKGGSCTLPKEQQNKVVPSKQQQVEEHKRSQKISLSPPSSPSQSPSPQPKRNKKQKDATPQSRKWVSDGSRWITEEEASKRVAIDWHNTLSKGNNERVHWQDRDALQMLQEKGYYLILLSYSGKERAEETLKELQKQDLLQFFEEVRFTWKKCGKEHSLMISGLSSKRYGIEFSLQ